MGEKGKEMFSLKETKKKSSQSKRSLTPGTYCAIVTAVEDDDNFINGGAFWIRYEIHLPDGTFLQKFSEKFLNDIKYPRTKDLADLLQTLGKEDVEELVGVKLEITVKSNLTQTGISPTITQRSPWTP